MKPALTFEQQLDLLLERGMILDVSRDYALSFLAENNYYRLSGYFKLFCKSGCDEFIDGFSFNALRRLYIFDFDLRRVLNDLLEEVEVIVKTQIAYHLSLNISPDFYLNGSYFHNQSHFNNFSIKVHDEITKNRTSPIVMRYANETMPIWALVELLSLGTISKMFSNLKTAYRKMVSDTGKYYEYNNNAFATYLYVTVQLRNKCAHRGRLYARYINANISFSQEDLYLLNSFSYPYNASSSQCTVFMAIYAAFKLINDKAVKQSYIDKIQHLFVQYNDVVNPNLLGFFDNWDEVLIG